MLLETSVWVSSSTAAEIERIFSEIVHPNCWDCCGIKTIYSTARNLSFCVLGFCCLHLTGEDELDRWRLLRECETNGWTGSGGLSTKGPAGCWKRRQLQGKTRRHRSGKDRGRVEWYGWGEKNKRKQQLSVMGWRSDMVQVVQPRSKRQELERGGKRKKQKTYAGGSLQSWQDSPLQITELNSYFLCLNIPWLCGHTSPLQCLVPTAVNNLLCSVTFLAHSIDNCTVSKRTQPFW